MVLVIYFSGTGNSRYAAQAIAGHLRDTLFCANDCIKRNIKADCTSDTPFIFVAPTYAWQIPRIFSDFIKNGRFTGNKKAYFIMSCGDDMGRPELFLEKLCADKNFYIMGVAAVVMPENYVALFDVTETSEADRLICLADNILKELAHEIARAIPFSREKYNLWGNIKSRVMNPLFYAIFVKAKGFWISEKCIGCGLCEISCPLNNIKLIDGKPIYGNECTHCMACICGCPTVAIEYKGRTAGKARYLNTKNPDVTSL